MQRIYLNIEDSLFAVLENEAINQKTSIANIIVSRLSEDFLSTKNMDSDCLKLLVDDALSFESNNAIGTIFTVADLPSLNTTELLVKKEYKRSAQRPAVSKAFNAVVRKGQLPGIACLVERKADGSIVVVKTNRNSTYVVVMDSIIWEIGVPHYVVLDANNKPVRYSIDEKLNSIITTEYRPPQFDIENAVNTLKELAEHGRCSMPKYEYGTPEHLGYDEDGNQRWCCTCSVISEKTGITRQVWSTSKKATKKAAAYLVLCDLFELQNQYGVNGKYTIWQLKDGKLMPE